MTNKTVADGYHVPVLLQESVDGMAITPDSICVDVTFGGGGHSREILSRLGENGHLFSFDQDDDTLVNLPQDKRFTFVKSNFRYLKNFVKYYEEDEVDAILADLGVSSHHFDKSERGFSFRYEDSNLDMRMNQKSIKTAAKILNEYTDEQLADVFYYYGEIRQARQLASAVVKTRQNTPFKTAADLLAILNPFMGKGAKDKKIQAQVFQALRIEVNDEMDALKGMLLSSLEVLRKGGRISVITYHSLEDRLVKNFFKSGNFEGKVEKDFYGNVNSPFKIINNKVIVPDNDELQRNPRSRSAKLRIAEKL